MDLGVRFYLFADVGLQRISQRLMNGLAQGTDAMPQYAGTKLRVANVLVEMDNGKPIKISRADGSFLTFDKNGQVHNDLVASGFAAMETCRALESADRTATERKVAADFEHLLEPALKGVSFEALRLAKVDQHTALWFANSNGTTI